MIEGKLVRSDGSEFDVSGLSYESILIARAYDKASDYGKAIIKCVLNQEQKNHDLKAAMKKYLEGFE